MAQLRMILDAKGIIGRKDLSIIEKKLFEVYLQVIMEIRKGK